MCSPCNWARKKAKIGLPTFMSIESNLGIYINYDFDIQNPSVRIRRFNIRKPLRKLGVNADIVFRYEDLFPYKNILLSHFTEQTYKQCLELRKQGKKLFFDHSENLWNLPYQNEVFNLCDYIVCCSTKLAELTQPRLTSNFTKCVVIPDMAEQGSIKHQPKESNHLKVIWSGMGGNSHNAKQLKPIINDLGMDLTIISEHSDADIKWNLETYLDEMAKYDIAICPQNVVLQPAKSNVKLVTSMGVGLPVICNSNPAYLEIIKDGVNGFIANTDEEWQSALSKLKNLELRKQFSKASLATAESYTPKAIAQRWVELLNQKPFKPSIAFINNTLRQKYLSYGDKILDELRLSGYSVTEYRYEDIDILPSGYDVYLFIEVRYDPEKITLALAPLVLYTKEAQPLNNLPHFDLIISENRDDVSRLQHRGFVNVLYNDHPDFFQVGLLEKVIKHDFIQARIAHNERLHSQHINSFWSLQLPEIRWPGLRDKSHIDFTLSNTKEGEGVLDVGSADGWLTIYLAKAKRNTSALEFVDRGIEWTKQQAIRHNVSVDIRKGAVENVLDIFSDQKFDVILCYEILEHLDYRRLPDYLEKLEKMLLPNGRILISLPSQNMEDNDEHLWSPNEALIRKLFESKSNFHLEWFPLPDHPTPGHWFIRYSKEEHLWSPNEALIRKLFIGA